MPVDNPELKLAEEYVNYTGSHIFLTGKAGTGKTTFLYNLRDKTSKRMIVTAPTGVAAINAGGVTLHSFFQLPFGPFYPGSEAYESNRGRMHRFSKEKKKIIHNLDLLVIDEISMVRADLLDAVDSVLRRHRRSNEPFGGVQLLMIGDLHQLSPVAKNHEWALLEPHYDSVYFFSSHALSRTELVTIELKHIYRQSDPVFIRLLNRVRDNRLEESDLEELNRRYSPDYKSDNDGGHIILTTHNAKADAINQRRLDTLKKKERSFRAEITDSFPEYLYPAPAILRLKIDAQVMFLRNDPNKSYFNGKIGRIEKFSDDAVHVVCDGEKKVIAVEKTEWENIQYKVNHENGEIEAQVIGKFVQYPLKPAWAITIHKSQGLTFDKAVIDAKEAFAHGQVYVALSRLRTLEGLSLRSPIPLRGIGTDEAVRSFDKSLKDNPPSENRLHEAKVRYQQELLLDCHDCRPLLNRLDHLTWLIENNASVIRISGVTDMNHLRKNFMENPFAVSEKFRRQLRSIFDTHDTLPEKDALVLERIGKASAWFQEQFDSVFGDFIRKMRVETDNSKLRKQIHDAVKEAEKEIAVKLAGFRSCENGFSPEEYLSSISDAASEIEKKKPDKEYPDKEYMETDIENPELFQSLRRWRSRKAKELDIAHFQILHQRVLISICMFLPDNRKDLGKISGIGKKTIERYGRDIIEIVSSYRKKSGINKVSSTEP